MEEAESSGQRTLQAVARQLLELEPGDRLPTAVELQTQLGVGSGTVQRILKSLESVKTVTLRARGHLGTYIETSDVIGLWKAAGLGAPHVALPPVGSREILGIAMALTSELERLVSLPTFGYYRGAAARIARLAESADLTVVSSGAAAHLGLIDDPMYLTRELAPNSYYAPGSLVVVSRGGRRSSEPLRVGIDPTSDDHERLTRAEFADASAEFVPTDFRRLPVAVLEGEIDTGIWHRVELLITPEQAGLEVRPIGRATTKLSTELSTATLVACAATPGAALLRDIDAAELVRIADLVVASSDTSEFAGPGTARLL